MEGLQNALEMLEQGEVPGEVAAKGWHCRDPLAPRPA